MRSGSDMLKKKFMIVFFLYALWGIDSAYAGLAFNTALVSKVISAGSTAITLASEAYAPIELAVSTCYSSPACVLAGSLVFAVGATVALMYFQDDLGNLIGVSPGLNTNPPCPSGWTCSGTGITWTPSPPASAPCSTSPFVNSAGVSAPTINALLALMGAPVIGTCIVSGSYCTGVTVAGNYSFVSGNQFGAYQVTATGKIAASISLSNSTFTGGTSVSPTGYGTCSGGVAPVSNPSAVPYPSDSIPSFIRNGVGNGYITDSRDPDLLNNGLPIPAPPSGQLPTPFNFTGQDSFGNPENITLQPTGDGGADLSATVQTKNPTTGQNQTQTGTSHISSSGVVTSNNVQPIQANNTLSTAIAENTNGGSGTTASPTVSTAGLAQDSSVQAGTAATNAASTAITGALQSSATFSNPGTLSGVSSGLADGNTFAQNAVCGGHSCSTLTSCSTGLCSSSENYNTLKTALTIPSFALPGAACTGFTFDFSGWNLGVVTMN